MTPKVNRREFTVKVTTFLAATATYKAVRGAQIDPIVQFEKVSDNEQNSWDSLITDAITTWKPSPELQIRHLEVDVSEHASFLKNAMAVRIRADTDQKLIVRGVDPGSIPRIGLMTIINVPRSAIGVPRDKFRQNFHAMLNAPGVFHWVEERNSIVSFDMEINS